MPIYFLIKSIRTEKLTGPGIDRWDIFLASVTRYPVQTFVPQSTIGTNYSTLNTDQFNQSRLRTEHPNHKDHMRNHVEPTNFHYYTYSLEKFDPLLHKDPWDRRSLVARKMEWSELKSRYEHPNTDKMYDPNITLQYSRPQSTSLISIHEHEITFPHSSKKTKRFFGSSPGKSTNHIIWARVNIAPILFGDNQEPRAQHIFSCVIIPARSEFALPNRYLCSDVGTFLRPYDFVVNTQCSNLHMMLVGLREGSGMNKGFKQAEEPNKILTLEDKHRYTEVLARLKWQLAQPQTTQTLPSETTPVSVDNVIKRPGLFAYIRPKFGAENVIVEGIDYFSTHMSILLTFCRGFDLAFKLRRINHEYDDTIDFYFYLPGETFGPGLPGKDRSNGFTHAFSKHEHGRMLTINNNENKIPKIHVLNMMDFLTENHETFHLSNWTTSDVTYVRELDFRLELVSLNLLQKFLWDHSCNTTFESEIQNLPPNKISWKNILQISDKNFALLQTIVNFLSTKINHPSFPRTTRILGSESLIRDNYFRNIINTAEDTIDNYNIVHICNMIGIKNVFTNSDHQQDNLELRGIAWVCVATLQLATNPVIGGYLETKISALHFFIWCIDKLILTCKTIPNLTTFVGGEFKVESIERIIHIIKESGCGQILINTITEHYDDLVLRQNAKTNEIIWKYPINFRKVFNTAAASSSASSSCSSSSSSSSCDSSRSSIDDIMWRNHFRAIISFISKCLQYVG